MFDELGDYNPREHLADGRERERRVQRVRPLPFAIGPPDRAFEQWLPMPRHQHDSGKLVGLDEPLDDRLEALNELRLGVQDRWGTLHFSRNRRNAGFLWSSVSRDITTERDWDDDEHSQLCERTYAPRHELPNGAPSSS